MAIVLKLKRPGILNNMHRTDKALTDYLRLLLSAGNVFIFLSTALCIYFVFNNPEKSFIFLFPILGFFLVYLSIKKPHLIVYVIVFLIPMQSLKSLSYGYDTLHVINIMIGALFLITLFKRITRRERLLSKLTAWVFVYLIFVAISVILLSGNIYKTFIGPLFVDLFFAILLVPILDWNLKDYRQLKYITFVILFSVMIQTVLAYLQFIWGEPFYISLHHDPSFFAGTVGIPVGTFQGPGKFAEYVLLAFCFVVGMWFDKKYLARSISFVLMALFFFIVIISGSRSISASMILSPLLMMLLLSNKGALTLSRIAKRGIFLIFIVVLLVVLIFEYSPQTATQRIVTKVSGEMSVDKDVGRLGMRSAINRASIDMFVEDPIAGKGYGNFANYSAPYVMKYNYTGGYQYKDWEAHNMYTMNLVENGLIGFILFIGILASGYKNFRQSLREISPVDRLPLIMVTSFFVYYILQLFSMFFGYGLYFHIMLSLGISAALRNITMGDSSDKPLSNRVRSGI